MNAERLAEVFGSLADLPRWVPWRMVWNPTANKGEGAWDKIPSNGRFGISTNRPENWGTLQAAATVQVEQGLSGVGFVLTNGVELAGWTLLGLDFDKVTPEFKLPFETYAETSPSGKGVRALAWVPTAWAAEYKDTLDAQFVGCDHCEAYFGTSPRFLTITFKALNDFGVARLTDADLKKLKLKHRKADLPTADYEDGEGTPINLNAGQRWTPEQQACIDGKPGIDRSNVIHGIVMVLVNAGHSQADIFATMLRHPPFWKYCLDHRHDDPARAAYFAREEITRAFNRTAAGTQARVLAQWQAQGKPTPPQHKQIKPGESTDEETKPVWVGPAEARRPDLFEQELEAREFIVDQVIPVSNGIMVAPGGIGKSALTLWEGAHIILGLPVWNRKVLRPGPVLFLTAEDQAADLDYRMQQIANAMNLNPAQRKRLLDGYFVEDVSGKMVRFVEKDLYGNLIFTEHIGSLVQKYESEGLSLINIDPHNLFGPGESLLNDGEAAMAAAANAICNDLNCHVRYIKHTGQQVARDKIRDQYSGRGGSAGADNVRQVMQVTNGTFKDAPLPKPAELRAGLMGSAVQILTIDFHKISYGPPQFDHPTLIVRSGWKFEQYEKAVVDPASDAELVNDMQVVCRHVRHEVSQGRYPTQRNVIDTRPGGLTQAACRVAVSAAVAKGWLVKADMPADQRVGAAKDYLKPADKED